MRSLCAKNYIFSRYYTPLYKKDVKETQNKPIETTSNKNSKTVFDQTVLVVQVKTVEYSTQSLRASTSF